MSKEQINSRYYIMFSDEMYGCTGSSIKFMPLPKSQDLDMEKCLKKWFNHILKTLEPYVKRGYRCSVYAMMECEDGSYSDLSCYWGCQELDHDPKIPF